jgi:hypothetical protein
MAKKKTGTLDKVSDALKDAAHTVNDKVVQPAAKALGLGTKKKPTRAAAKKGGAKAAKTGARKSAAAKGGAARKKTGTAKKKSAR